MFSFERFRKSAAVATAVAIFFVVSCSSSTLITSDPPGASVFIEGSNVGTTPYTHKDRKIAGSTLSVRLEKEGYEPLQTTITKDEDLHVGSLIGGLFFLWPFIWILEYNESHFYKLNPLEQYIDPSQGYGLEGQGTEYQQQIDFYPQQADPYYQQQVYPNNQQQADPYYQQQVYPNNQQQAAPQYIPTKEEKLRELQRLYEQKLINKDEYEAAKSKVLMEN